MLHIVPGKSWLHSKGMPQTNLTNKARYVSAQTNFNTQLQMKKDYESEVSLGYEETVKN